MLGWKIGSKEIIKKLEEKEFANLLKREIIKKLEEFANPLKSMEVSFWLLNEKFNQSNQTLDRSILANWRQAIINYNSGIGDRDKTAWKYLREKNSPYPVPEGIEPWDGTLKDSDFDGILDDWDKYPNDPKKIRVVKRGRQANQMEQEPNDSPEQANLIQWGYLDGQINREGDVDWFKFTWRARTTNHRESCATD
jgi:hypothetical protein